MVPQLVVTGAILGLIAGPLIAAALYALRAAWRPARAAYREWEWTALTHLHQRRYSWAYAALHPCSLAHTAWIYHCTRRSR
jgi:hypothetical protein